jgi:hypothetical protein
MQAREEKERKKEEEYAEMDKGEKVCVGKVPNP